MFHAGFVRYQKHRILFGAADLQPKALSFYSNARRGRQPARPEVAKPRPYSAPKMKPALFIRSCGMPFSLLSLRLKNVGGGIEPVSDVVSF
jgi:hypothetical protein